MHTLVFSAQGVNSVPMAANSRDARETLEETWEAPSVGCVKGER